MKHEDVTLDRAGAVEARAAGYVNNMYDQSSRPQPAQRAMHYIGISIT